MIQLLVPIYHPKNMKSPITKQTKSRRQKQTCRNTPHEEKDYQNPKDKGDTRTTQEKHYQINTNVREEDSVITCIKVSQKYRNRNKMKQKEKLLIP